MEIPGAVQEALSMSGYSTKVVGYWGKTGVGRPERFDRERSAFDDLPEGVGEPSEVFCLVKVDE